MRTALAANGDVAMIEVPQIACSEMPEATRMLERALECIVEDGRLDSEESTLALLSSWQGAGKGNGSSINPGDVGADTLDNEFIKTGIHALQRLSKDVDLGLLSWTITQFEIDLEEKVGVEFFSDVTAGLAQAHGHSQGARQDDTSRGLPARNWDMEVSQPSKRAQAFQHP